MALKVFSLNEDDYWMAESLSEAIDSYLHATGMTLSEASIADDVEVADVVEVATESMQRLVFYDDDGTSRTFQEELDRRVAAGETKPQCFASTAW